MGDLRYWSPEPNGAVMPAPVSYPAAIGAGCWEDAEKVAQEIITLVHPTVVSETRRKEVIEYMQSLIRDCLGCEVFPFGSVPLKTYLPDGDIDLTIFGGLNVEEALAGDLCSVLEGEEQNMAAKFVIKDVQLIRAEVKLVKCLVQNIVVDISFNQLGGLCTLCFLEQVNCRIGKSHLFKRSVMLIKAWCYYESRILGAHHGLISTYALETLVLYIFHRFHSSLNGPIAVLYKFLDYFSKFDWDNYCISLSGPVLISSLPEFLAGARLSENGGGDLLLSDEFLRASVEMFAVPPRGSETISRTFPPKHLNIVDPLKENNNLGRSVSKGNFYRIRSAFSYGARKLGHILSSPEESVAHDIRKFFGNTLERHGKGQRPDVQDTVALSAYTGFGPKSPFSDIETCQEDMRFSDLGSANFRGMSGQYRLGLVDTFCNGLKNVEVVENELDRRLAFFASAISSKAESNVNGIAVSGTRLDGDAEDLATSGIHSLKISDDISKSSSPQSEESMLPFGKAYHVPHQYYSRPDVGIGKRKTETPEWKQPEISISAVNKESYGLQPASPHEETGIIAYSHQDETDGSIDAPLKPGPIDCSLDDFHLGYREWVSVGTVGSPIDLKSLPDLGGDYENHRHSLNYGRMWFECALGTHIPPMPPSPLSGFQSKDPWDMTQWSAQYRQDVFAHMNANGVVPQQAFYPVNQPIIPGAAFGREEKPKLRGTGTYFPNMNHYRDNRPLHPRGMNHAQARSPRNNGRAMMCPETNSREISVELSQAQFPVLQGSGRPRFSDLPRPDSPGRKVFPNAEFGYSANPPPEPPLNAESSYVQGQLQRQKSILGVNQNRVALQSYRLKDEDDFPPLSI